MAETATLRTLRDTHSTNGIVFVHGFGGDPTATWGSFPDFLKANPLLDGWNIYSLGYTSRLAPDFKGLWSGDPSISTIANFLHTHTTAGELERCKALVFIAHSMGGLAVQRALMDHAELLKRTSHVFLFGTPSDGLGKAGWIRWFKRQTGDMAAGGPFILDLRRRWNEGWPKSPPPHFWTIAGEIDEFVPATSSLGPFANEQRMVVPGNHLDIVKPKTADDLSVRIVVRGIQGDAAPAGPGNAANVALQMLNFREVVDKFEPRVAELDDPHLVRLAIALEGLGQSQKALQVLERSKKLGTDARGVLAGRLKRRWIAEGREADYTRALELYSSAYEQSVANQNDAQAFYHGINVCFLLAANSGDKSRISAMAGKVLEHCARAPRDFWCLGTQGEAKLYQGDSAGALASYREAVNLTPAPEPWKLQSMYSQAYQLAAILERTELTEDLRKLFRQEANAE